MSGTATITEKQENEEEEEDDDPLFFMADDLFSNDKDCDSDHEKRRLVVVRQQKQQQNSERRNWGLPTFQDQMDRGIKTYTLYKEEDTTTTSSSNNNSVLIHLEHRLHSTGSDIWDSGLVLSHALSRREFMQKIQTNTQQQQPMLEPLLVAERANKQQQEPFLSLQGKTILELGSGTGMVGIFCSKCLGAKYVIVTDLVDNLQLIQKNCTANQCQVLVWDDDENGLPNKIQDTTANTNNKKGQDYGFVSIQSLDWNTFQEQDALDLIHNITKTIGNPNATNNPIDFIIGSDLFLPYATFLLHPLCQTIAHLLTQLSKQNHHETKAILCYEERFDCSPFFDEAKRLGLHVIHIPNEWLHPKYQDPGRIHILQISLSPPES